MLAVHPKFSHADQLGVMGFLAFLADTEACAARLTELQKAAEDSAEAEKAAQEASERAKE